MRLKIASSSNPLVFLLLRGYCGAYSLVSELMTDPDTGPLLDWGVLGSRIDADPQATSVWHGIHGIGNQVVNAERSTELYNHRKVRRANL